MASSSSLAQYQIDVRRSFFGDLLFSNRHLLFLLLFRMSRSIAAGMKLRAWIGRGPGHPFVHPLRIATGKAPSPREEQPQLLNSENVVFYVAFPTALERDHLADGLHSVQPGILF